jgi:outer membrane lipoprotein carrier protein
MRACLLLCCLAAASSGADLELSAVLRAVEQRYNRAATLEAEFEQRHLVEGRPRRIESGRLVLRKPGRMRWEYARPAGKLFVCDGRWVWLYTPGAQQVERARLKEADDFRAPLAFLLGRLDFRRAFASFELSGTAEAPEVRAWPKSDRAPFTRVDFMMDAQSAIRRLVIHSPDGTAMEFLFSGERLNVAVPESAFQFFPPAGIPVVESGQ